MTYDEGKAIAEIKGLSDNSRLFLKEKLRGSFLQVTLLNLEKRDIESAKDELFLHE